MNRCSGYGYGYVIDTEENIDEEDNIKQNEVNDFIKGLG